MSRDAFFWTKASPYLRSVLRIIMGFLYMQHGGNKLLGFPGNDHIVLISPDKMLTLTPGLAGILELGGGLLLLVGLFSRPVAFILSGEMAFAYFMVHINAGPLPFLNGGGMAVAFCFVFLYLSAAGPGPWSIDRALWRR
jgi:putative oxidoreductase